MAKTTTYCSCEGNGREGAERVANKYRSDNTIVTIEHVDDLPQWGSGNPYSSNYGAKESGYRITVNQKTSTPKKRIIGW